MRQLLGETMGAVARSRLAAAALFSAALHLGVMFGVGVGGEGGGDARRVIESAPDLRLKLVASVPAKPSQLETRARQEEVAALPRQPSAPADAAPGPGGGVHAPRYFFSSELGERPKVLAPITPGYPDRVQSRAHYVMLRVFINEHGAVDEVAVLNADPNGAFEKAARAAFAQARFLPGQRDGKPVRSQMLVEVKFDPGLDALLTGEAAPTAPPRGGQGVQPDTVPSAARAR